MKIYINEAVEKNNLVIKFIYYPDLLYTNR